MRQLIGLHSARAVPDLEERGRLDAGRTDAVGGADFDDLAEGAVEVQAGQPAAPPRNDDVRMSIAAADRRLRLSVLPFTGELNIAGTGPHALALLGDQDHLRQNLADYIAAFSPSAHDIFERFDFAAQVERLHKANLLYLVTEKFANIDLHPDVVSNAQMGAVFEELIRRFAELSNETAGEHFTPREVIRLMVDLLFIEDDDALAKPGIVRTLLDPACGTGGMLSVAAEYVRERNPRGELKVFGQELNGET